MTEAKHEEKVKDWIMRAEAAEAQLQALHDRLQALEADMRARSGQYVTCVDLAERLATLTQPGAASPETEP